MSWQSSLSSAVAALRKEEQRLQRELSDLRGRIGTLSGATRGKRGPGHPPGGTKRKMSAAGRAAISRAAKKRWAAWRKAKK